MKISFHSYANKPNFHMKSAALSLALGSKQLRNGLFAIFPCLPCGMLVELVSSRCNQFEFSTSKEKSEAPMGIEPITVHILAS